MILYLKWRGYGTGLDLPATPNDAASTVFDLTAGSESGEPVQISGVSSPIPNLYPYIQHADFESEPVLQKLNSLARQIDRMTQEEQRLFSGALELEGTGGLDDAVSIAGSLDRYELLPKIKTDGDLGRFLMDTAFTAGKISVSESDRPCLNYTKIGMEHRDTLGGVYTHHGLVRHREKALAQTETPWAMLLTLTAEEHSCSLPLPASEEQMESAKKGLGIEDFSQTEIAGAEYAVPCLEQLIPTDYVTVEDANVLSLQLQQLKADGEMMKYCSALEVEDPTTFSEAVSIAMNIDDYEQVTEDPAEYGEHNLRLAGAGDEILDMLNGYTDFERLGRDIMEEECVRQTEFGLVRRLSEPFPRQEMGQAMKGMV